MDKWPDSRVIDTMAEEPPGKVLDVVELATLGSTLRKRRRGA